MFVQGKNCEAIYIYIRICRRIFEGADFDLTYWRKSEIAEKMSYPDHAYTVASESLTSAITQECLSTMCLVSNCGLLYV